MTSKEATEKIDSIIEKHRIKFNEEHPFNFTGEAINYPFALEIHKRVEELYIVGVLKGYLIGELTTK